MEAWDTARVGAATAEPPLDAVCLVSPARLVLWLSEGAGTVLGLDRPAPVGDAFATLLDPGSAEEFDRAWRRAVGDGRPVECVVRGRGAPTHLRLRLEPSSSGDGPTVAVIRAAASGSEELQREARLLRGVTEAANEASATPDLFARVVADISDAMGWTGGQVHPAENDGSGADAPVLNEPQASAAAVAAWRTGLPTAARREAIGSADGDTAGAGVMAVPVVTDGEVAAVLEFATDGVVTLDGAMESLLTSVGRQLGLVVDRERTRAVLEERTLELERSNEELERFAYVASHDLQEPLRKIVGFAELLEHKYHDRFDGEGREYLEYVVDGAQRMQRLIKDLLAYSRAGRATPAPNAVDLTELMDRVLDVLQWSIEEAHADVVVGDLPTVWGDAGQLSEVLTNLVANAVKFGPEGGAAIRVDARPIADHGDRGMVEVTVVDDGIGIDPAYAEQVFEVFRRLHGPTEFPGTGIGLAITRRYAQANGGRVWVTRNDPTGCVFHLTIPLPPEEIA